MKYLLTLLLLTLSCNAGQMLNRNAFGVQGTAPPTAYESLVSRITFDSGDGAFQEDASGHGNYFTNAGTASEKPVVAGGYATFDGGDYMETTNRALLHGAAGYTVTAWIYPTLIADSYGILNCRNAPGNIRGLSFYYSAPIQRIVGYTATGENISTNIVPLNTWRFIAQAASTNSGSVLLDDTTPFTGGSVTMTISNSWKVGWDSYSASFYFRGRIDEVRIYNRKLTTDELTRVRAEGR